MSLYHVVLIVAYLLLCPVVGIMAGVVVARRDFRRRDGDES